MTAMTGTGILSTVINVVAESLLIPVLILLVIFILLVLVEVGGTLAEYSNRTKISDEELDNIINSIAVSKSSEVLIIFIRRFQNLQVTSNIGCCEKVR